MRDIWLGGTVALTVGAYVAAIALAPAADAPPVRALQWLLFLGSSVHVAAVRSAAREVPSGRSPSWA